MVRRREVARAPGPATTRIASECGGSPSRRNSIRPAAGVLDGAAGEPRDDRGDPGLVPAPRSRAGRRWPGRCWRARATSRSSRTSNRRGGGSCHDSLPGHGPGRRWGTEVRATASLAPGSEPGSGPGTSNAPESGRRGRPGRAKPRRSFPYTSVSRASPTRPRRSWVCHRIPASQRDRCRKVGLALPKTQTGRASPTLREGRKLGRDRDLQATGRSGP